MEFLLPYKKNVELGHLAVILYIHIYNRVFFFEIVYNIIVFINQNNQIEGVNHSNAK